MMTDKKEVELEKITELSDEELEKIDGGKGNTSSNKQQESSERLSSCSLHKWDAKLGRWVPNK